ncbi:HIT domain-containing protein [Micromonospora sp. NPDC053740]|uniref:HIT family protein n=1 Tax=Micromonospora sp. NPDC053740 TaxID=3155173 RepID=UPI00341AE067
MADLCVFCEIVAGREPATQVAAGTDAIAIRPLNPVVTGHLLVLPVKHVRDAAEDPHVSAEVMRLAAVLAPMFCPGAFNIITSAGREATQSVFHLHLHIVPRRADDGLALPWYSGKRSKAARRG